MKILTSQCLRWRNDSGQIKGFKPNNPQKGAQGTNVL